MITPTLPTLCNCKRSRYAEAIEIITDEADGVRRSIKYRMCKCGGRERGSLRNSTTWVQAGVAGNGRGTMNFTNRLAIARGK